MIASSCSYWDEDGFVIVYKQLERGTFALAGKGWPGQQSIRLRAAELTMLLYGIDWQTARGERGVITTAGDGVRCGSGRSRSFFRFSYAQTIPVFYASNSHEPHPSRCRAAANRRAIARTIWPRSRNMILELLVSMHQRDRDHQAMQHRLELLLRRLYGPRGERFNPNQLLLFPDLPADTLAASPPPTCEEKPKRKCRPHGRRRLPENLPRVPKHHELTSRRADLFGLWPSPRRDRHRHQRAVGLQTGVAVRHRALCPQVRLCML